MRRSYEQEFQISTIVNGNEVRLYRQYYAGGKYSYFIHWGVPGDNGQAVEELLTPKGRTPSEGGAIKKFLAATKAAQYLTFSKL